MNLKNLSSEELFWVGVGVSLIFLVLWPWPFS